MLVESSNRKSNLNVLINHTATHGVENKKCSIGDKLYIGDADVNFTSSQACQRCINILNEKKEKKKKIQQRERDENENETTAIVEGGLPLRN